MRILYAFPEPLPMPRARGVQVAHALHSLAEAGVDVTLAYVPEPGSSPFAPIGGSLPTAVTLRPVSRSWPGPLSRVSPFARWHSVQWFARRLHAEIFGFRPQLVYVRHLKLASLLLARTDMPPLIYEAHEVFADTAAAKKRKQVAAMEGQVIKAAAALVCNSQATADRLNSQYGPPRHLLVLPNGVAAPATVPAKDWDACRREIVYAGSFFGWKGVDDLVAAAAELKGFRISLIGGEAEQLERLRGRLPTDGAQVDLLPRLPHAEVMQHLLKACVAVLPNRADTDSAFTSPIKLFEYMAAGCAVVASDLPAIREILRPNEAQWFRPGDSQSLAQALRDICSDPAAASKLGQGLREKSATYTWQARAARLKSFMEDTIGAASDRA